MVKGVKPVKSQWCQSRRGSAKAPSLPPSPPFLAPEMENGSVRSCSQNRHNHKWQKWVFEAREGRPAERHTFRWIYLFSAPPPPVKSPLFPLPLGYLMPRNRCRHYRNSEQPQVRRYGAFDTGRWHPYPGPRIRRRSAPLRRGFSRTVDVGCVT